VDLHLVKLRYAYVRPIAAPRIFFRPGHKARADWIQVNVSCYFEQVSILVDKAIVKSALIQVAHAMIPLVEVTRVLHIKDLHKARKLCIMISYEKVDMV
jgi:hypothetical protein